MQTGAAFGSACEGRPSMERDPDARDSRPLASPIRPVQLKPRRAPESARDRTSARALCPSDPNSAIVADDNGGEQVCHSAWPWRPRRRRCEGHPEGDWGKGRWRRQLVPFARIFSCSSFATKTSSYQRRFGRAGVGSFGIAELISPASHRAWPSRCHSHPTYSHRPSSDPHRV